MKKNVIIVLLVVGVTANLVLNLLDRKYEKKLGYVRSQDLVYAFDGMKEMQLKFQEQSKVWEANMDTLKMEYQRSLSEYQGVMAQLTTEEKITREQLLYAQKNNILQYSENIQLKSKEEEDKMLEGVLNQVNSFVEEYGKDNNYDLILGTTLAGSILYGEEAIDITQELIVEINNNYNGK
ncbi:MAG: OmpH family outer membrane protein [Flavobacteriales bacterium]|nr:OmpH family outer membrane protein [Flavobacteriales bacterium]